MIGRNAIFEAKFVKQLCLLVIPPSHHVDRSAIPSPSTESRGLKAIRRLFQQNPPIAAIGSVNGRPPP
jgi:hypothetical protein